MTKTKEEREFIKTLQELEKIINEKIERQIKTRKVILAALNYAKNHESTN